MNTNPQLLEHRWGVRVRLDLPVELKITPRVSAISTVRDASLTGAFIETQADLFLLSRVCVRPIDKAGVWLDGYVVRVDDSGVAVEWCDPKLDQLSVLLHRDVGETRK